MQMPFQYSLHVQESSEDDLSSSDRHFQFIGNIEEDPRRAIAERMLKDIPKSGSIMAYNQSFEKNCIKRFKQHFTQEKMAKNYLKLYRSILISNRPATGIFSTSSPSNVV